ncbi:hypothetical protein CERSUDRAFT_99715 [Gelatoporia subvermispora B]|uniref:T6SS Phospholipase effector Tle1-like catalytic domain-containing protein n=1 Tax=Ceriporiopsis subvermispora (strain B) TaxID=914234 RepID=M2R191_CERS8|nr:hypothetical protein CERSUDRAFT_99715 [Gelatoporia subvermispora B]
MSQTESPILEQPIISEDTQSDALPGPSSSNESPATGKEVPPDTGGCQCPTHSGRNLVVCIDGTSNQFGSKNTNVIELYRLVKKPSDDDSDTDSFVQLTYYNSGIGTYAKPSWKSGHYRKQVIDHKIDLAIAWNFEKIVISAYRWLSDNYQKGDRIFLFGFSRGAYQVGLIHKGNEEQIPFAYELYAAADSSDGLSKLATSAKIKQKISRFSAWCTRKKHTAEDDREVRKTDRGPIPDVDTTPLNRAKVTSEGANRNTALPVHGADDTETATERFKKTFSRRVRVHFVGAWDTVSSVGVVRSKVLPGTADGMRHVCFFRHALALDERRVKFLPEYVYQGLSEKEKNDQDALCKHQAAQNSSHINTTSMIPESRSVHTKEVWFVGTHSDIGGGNVVNATLDRRAAALRWMMYEASREGLRLDDWILKQEAATNVRESLTGKWWLLELFPMKNLSYRTQQDTRRWPHRGAVRVIKDGQTFHQTVITSLDKAANGRNVYVPKARPMWHEEKTSYWEDLKKSENEQKQRVEPDLYDVAQNVVDMCMQKLQNVKLGDIITGKDLFSDVTKWADKVEGGHALRSRNASEALLEAAAQAQVADKLTNDHIVALVNTVLQIGVGTQRDLPLSEILSLRTRLQRHSKWADVIRMFPVKRDIFTLSGHTGGILSIAVSRDGTRIASGGVDKTVRIWDVSTGTAVGSPLDGHSDVVRSVAFSPDGTHVVSGLDDHAIRVWNLKTGTTVVGPIKGHTRGVRSVTYSPDGTRIVSGSDDGTIRIWDAKTGAAVGEPLRGHQYWVRSVAFSPDGTRIASGSDDRTVRIWDAATGTALGSPLTGHDWLVGSVAFSPDGTRVVSGSLDDTIRVWDVQTGDTVVGPITGHAGYVFSVAYSPKGSRIVSGSRDRIIRIWDAKTGKAIGKPLTGHEGPVSSVAFSPDGKRVVSGSHDRTVRIWDVEDLVVE